MIAVSSANGLVDDQTERTPGSQSPGRTVMRLDLPLRFIRAEERLRGQNGGNPHETNSNFAQKSLKRRSPTGVRRFRLCSVSRA
ncbi:hypothetical protein J4573_01640 [Actinomadura barringtoniae]|uniref:Uncharacterized protein n=1 Tax=Actinomadura barringtoniae TaxID=1427535 RepID=A0A939P5Q0_9ACTN|nr:hypothetical protein [Actinomadura barringtoniae]MBO2445782.1 hypothetical protein [Actinomadura barringtoniae]